MLHPWLVAGLDDPRASGKLNESINLPLPPVPTDPILPIFIAGALAGAAIVMLAGVAPDIIFIISYIAARRRSREHRDHPGDTAIS